MPLTPQTIFFVNKHIKRMLADTLDEPIIKKLLFIKDYNSNSIAFSNKELSYHYGILSTASKGFDKPLAYDLQSQKIDHKIIDSVGYVFKTPTAPLPILVNAVLKPLKYVIEDSKKYTKTGESPYDMFNKDYHIAHFKQFCINDNVSILKSEDVDAGSQYSLGHHVQFKATVYYKALLTNGASEVSVPLKRGQRADFIVKDKAFKKFDFDVKLGRQEVDVLQSNNCELTYSVSRLSDGEPILSLKDLSKIVLSSLKPLNNVSNGSDRHLLVAFDIAPKERGTLDEFTMYQNYINKIILPSLKEMNLELSVPKSLHFIFVGPVIELEETQHLDLINLNYLPLKENGVICDLQFEYEYMKVDSKE